MQTVGERIKAFRIRTGMSQKVFAEECAKIDTRESATKWGQSRIGNYEINARKPDLDDIQIIAKVLGIDAAELAFGDNTEVELAGKPKEGLIKVIGEAVMGFDGEFEMSEQFTGFLKIYSSDPESYCLRVKGNSMEPRIFSGEFVVIEPNTPYHNGDEVFIRTIEGKNMIKTFDYYRDGEYRFSSVNQEHSSFTLDIEQIDKIAVVSAIVKRSRFIALEAIPELEIIG